MIIYGLPTWILYTIWVTFHLALRYGEQVECSSKNPVFKSSPLEKIRITVGGSTIYVHAIKRPGIGMLGNFPSSGVKIA